MVNVTSQWSASDYAANAAFVPELGAAALALLNPRPGELILDLGCGDGALTARIVAAGARAVGVDSSEEMVEAARARGLEAYVADAEAGLAGHAERFGRFDAVFSNAALHWMTEIEAVAAGVFAVLKEGGRFVGEMGGAGNLATIRAALRAELEGRGYAMPAEDPAWYPDPESFAKIYCGAGFAALRAELIERPTPLPAGVAGWVRTFRSGLLDSLMVPEWERDEIAASVEARVEDQLRQPDDSWCADYVRLRFWMRKPE
ncbi:class I SAM-dependent methyltransferase [Sphingosinicella sp.]|uniref:class I SAM-dependent methyltransferase n=1 Tax=Sphingosinicella sp. TaxID=1917971 RepID=UPI004037827F